MEEGISDCERFACPYCKSKNVITAQEWSVFCGTATKKYECLDCDKEWMDIYKLSYVETLDMMDA